MPARLRRKISGFSPLAPLAAIHPLAASAGHKPSRASLPTLLARDAQPAEGPPPVPGPGTAAASRVVPAIAETFAETVGEVAPTTAMAFPATADEAMVVQAMADQVTVDETAETETVDSSVEEAFFERSIGFSDRPVSFDFDADLAEPSLDLEAREVRRAHFKRVVGGIIAALGVGALLALVQPGRPAIEDAPAVAACDAPVEMPEMQLIEPAPAPPPAPSVSAFPTTGLRKLVPPTQLMIQAP